MHKDAPKNNFLKAKVLRTNMTIAEKKLWDSLKGRKLHSYKFRRQHPIHLFIVDFYCHELKLIIEVDGGYHNEDLQIENDRAREALLKFQDVYILRFTNDEVLFDLDTVLGKIEDCIDNLPK